MLNLSPRQIQMSNLVCKGYTYKQVAYKLAISESTVKNMMHDAHRRLGVNNNVQMAVKLLT